MINVQRQRVFNGIYRSHRWGKDNVGPGSKLANCQPYVSFLNSWLPSLYSGSGGNVNTVLDIGCGIWEYQYRVSWPDRGYIGWDIVPQVTQRNRECVSGTVGSFYTIDAVNESPTDMVSIGVVLIKDVFQHLSWGSINSLMDRVKRIKGRPLVLVTTDFPEQTNRNPSIDRQVDGQSYPRDLERDPSMDKFGFKRLLFFGSRKVDGSPITKATYLYVPPFQG